MIKYTFLFFILIQMKGNAFNYYVDLIKDNNSYSTLAKIYVAFTSDERLTKKEIEILDLIYQFKIKY